MREAVRALRLRSELTVVDAPSAASIVIVAGVLPDQFSDPLALLHDGLPHPRAIIWWKPGTDGLALVERFPDVILVDGDELQLVASVVRVHRELFTGGRPSSPSVMADVGAAPWQGVGPYGQGGSGMTGGVPYGRPMAEVAPDRDGLRLDVLPVTVGPFFPPFPPGLRLDAKFAGDIVVDCAVPANPFTDVPHGAGRVRPGLDIFSRALFEPVPVAALELARARDHLTWLADALTAHGLPALGLRALRLAVHLRADDAPLVRRFIRSIEWTQVLQWSTRGVGRFGEDARESLRGCGPVARAAGLCDDVRSEDRAYEALGFAAIGQDAGDAAARWRQRLDEIAQSLDLAGRAGALQTELIGRVESPRGLLIAGSAPTRRLLPLIPGLINGVEWGDAVTSLVSLDLDLEEAALAERLPTTTAGAL